jgi:hypothetical protein
MVTPLSGEVGAQHHRAGLQPKIVVPHQARLQELLGPPAGT